MIPLLAAALALQLGTLAAADSGLSWLDAVSRIGVVGILALALYGLQKRWWVPGWVYSELVARHDRLREQRDKAVETALLSSRGVKRTASVVEEALARAEGERR